MAAVYFFIIEQILTIRDSAKREQAQRFMEKEKTQDRYGYIDIDNQVKNLAD